MVQVAGNQCYAITGLGALLFARDLDTFDPLRFRRVRITRYQGTTKVHAINDYFENGGYASSFKSVLERLNLLLPTNELIKESLRQNLPMYPEVALREFLANAMIHQDFEQHGMNLHVEIYDDRLEISNPGVPVIDVKRFVDDSQTRNPQLADVMRKLNICESRGSGIDRVLLEIELHQLPAPGFTTGSHSTKISMVARQRFAEMVPGERVWAAYLHCCLRYVSNSYMTNSSLRQRFGLGTEKSSMISAVISSALDLGLVRLDISSGESKRLARYVPQFAH